ncbi:nuclease-related domain-containing protein [Anoxybacillus ayderensis]|uniref:nuclease-related domain-containing protein n=1 Tax=Anoxybacillus ayderensis TaxID=265546 RepID=UPI002E1FF603|nr:nuclease-related domain-containing protein [Anoxybacillus ayderensis]
MAKIIPENPRLRTYGEKKLVKLFEQILDDLWTVYYEPIIEGKQPDFILFHEYQGIIIIEVKDYSKQSIKEINPDFWKIDVDGRIISVKSPIKQAIDYRNTLITVLSRENELLEKSGIYQRKLKIPIAIACIFPNLSVDEVKELGIERIIPKEQIFCRHDIETGENLINRIFCLTEHLFVSKGLTEKETSIINQCIYPVITVREGASLYISSDDIAYMSEPQVSFFSFDHYVDELHFVIDKTNHLIRLGEAKTIGIIYPINRSLREGTIAQFINSALQNLTLLVPSQSFSVYATDLRNVNCSSMFDYLFILDINTIRDGDNNYQRFNWLIKKSLKSKTNIILTANKKSSLTEKIRNRLAKR